MIVQGQGVCTREELEEIGKVRYEMGKILSLWKRVDAQCTMYAKYRTLNFEVLMKTLIFLT